MTERYVFIERGGGLLELVATATGSDGGSKASEVTRAGLGSVRLTPDCIASLQRFRAAGFELVLLVDPEDPGASDAALDGFVDALFGSQGLRFAVERCTHGGAAGCDCALPGIGLVEDYVADPALDRSGSLVVGGRDESLKLARALGVQGFRLGDGQHWPDVAHAVLDRPRRALVRRTTRETDIEVTVDLDRAAPPAISTGIGFFDHMLEQLGKHGGFELRVECKGDLEVDEHHTIEDAALAIGDALKRALGDKRGIGRYGFLLPMDEAEAQVAIDLSGRAYAVFDGKFPRDNVGGLPTELVRHFFRSLADALGAAVHVSVRGENAHHMVEACFKGVARALRQAIAREGTELPSTKGTL